MRQLWSDIVGHPRTALAFLLYWIGLWTLTFFTWAAGMSPVALLLHISAPIIAGGIVGLWRFPIREGLLVGRTRLAGAPLAAALVAISTVSVVFIAEGARKLLSGRWETVVTAEFFLSWVAASVLLAIISLVFGLLGAFISALLASSLNRMRRDYQQ